MPRIYILIGIALGLWLMPATRGMAQLPLYTDNDLIGQSDLIVVGTVVSDTRVPDANHWQDGQAVIAIDSVLRGPMVTRITVRHATPPVTQPGIMITDSGGFVLTPGQRSIFFLQRTPGGYVLAAGGQGVKPADTVDTYRQMITNFPYTVSLDPVPPCYFGQPVTVTMKVKNTGRTAVECLNQMLEGQFYAPLMGGSVPFSIETASPLGLGFYPSQRQTLQEVMPGGEITLTVKIVCAKPASWALFMPDTYLQTPVMARASVILNPSGPAITNAKQPAFTVTSEWTMVMVGFPPPPAM